MARGWAGPVYTAVDPKAHVKGDFSTGVTLEEGRDGASLDGTCNRPLMSPLVSMKLR